jgi:hypothetical protein
MRMDTVVRDGRAYTRRSRSTAIERDEHSLAGYQAGCRCGRCRSARRRFDRTWRAAAKVRRGGEAIWLVPARRTSERLVELNRAGWTRAAIAAATGVSPTTLHRVASHPEARCWSTVADAVARLS